MGSKDGFLSRVVGDLVLSREEIRGPGGDGSGCKGGKWDQAPIYSLLVGNICISMNKPIFLHRKKNHTSNRFVKP